MGKNLEAKSITLKTLFEANEHFWIPKYQRTYEWGKGDVLDLIDDMLDSSNSADKPYFIGPIIVKTKSRYTLEIVDGQQRIMTNYLFRGWTAAFYKKFLELNFPDSSLHSKKYEKLKEMYEDLVPSGRSDENYKNKPRVIPSALDAKEFNINTESIYRNSLDFFENISDISDMKHPEYDDDHYGQLLENDYSVKEFLETKLGYKFDEIKKFEDEVTNKIDEIFDDLIDYPNRVEIIEIILADYQDPIQIFNSLNSEGMELSEFDLVRSTLFDFFDENTSDEEESQFYMHKWLPFENDFVKKYKQKNPSATPKTLKKHKGGFLTNFLILEDRDSKIGETQKEMKKVFKENIKSNDNNIVAGLNASVANLKRYSVPYNIIVTGILPEQHQSFLNSKQHSNEFNKTKRRFLESVKSIHLYKPQKGCYAYLMKLIEEGMSLTKSSDVSRLRSIKTSLDIFESYTIRRHFRHDDGNPKNLFDPIARSEKFWDSAFLIGKIKENSSQRPFYTNKDLEIYYDNQTSPKSDKSLQSRKYFLYEYEKVIRGPTRDYIDIEELEVEHICPQSFEENWSDVIENEDDAGWINTIGNFTLITPHINKKNSNKPFKDKKAYFEDQGNKTIAPKEITKNKNQWGIKEIKENRKKMQAFLFKHWKDIDEFKK
tara:strand:- start:2572 stop:4542 length:1971 start_codon:yes stop_codon:yes gene_type:complete